MLAALEGVSGASPDHPGAYHYYIHAVEAVEPEKALAAADTAAATSSPGAGHLVHMPAHIYLRLGLYREATLSNELASQADESYIAQCNAQGFYPATYYPHNMHFLWYTNAMEGRSAASIAAAQRDREARRAHEARPRPSALRAAAVAGARAVRAVGRGARPAAARRRSSSSSRRCRTTSAGWRWRRRASPRRRRAELAALTRRRAGETTQGAGQRRPARRRRSSRSRRTTWPGTSRCATGEHDEAVAELTAGGEARGRAAVHGAAVLATCRCGTGSAPRCSPRDGRRRRRRCTART